MNAHQILEAKAPENLADLRNIELKGKQLFLRSVVLKLACVQNHPEGLLK